MFLDEVNPDFLHQSKTSVSVCVHRPQRFLSSKLQLETAWGGGGGSGVGIGVGGMGVGDSVGGIGVGANVGPIGPTCSSLLGDPVFGSVTTPVTAPAFNILSRPWISSPGFCSISKASPPVTCGHAIEVPDIVVEQSFLPDEQLLLPGTPADKILLPGAYMSKQEP